MIEKISKDAAEVEFNRFIDAMDLDVDPLDMDEEDKKGFEQQKKRVVKAIMSGALIVNDEGCPVFTPQRTEEDVNPITFYEPTGASLMAMDRKKRTEDVGKLYASMADITKTSAGLFSKMKMADLKVCMAVTTLFLG